MRIRAKKGRAAPRAHEMEKRPFGRSSVTPGGFEPPTNRTGICHSIQLNYGANMVGKSRKKPTAFSNKNSCCFLFRNIKITSLSAVFQKQITHRANGRLP